MGPRTLLRVLPQLAGDRRRREQVIDDLIVDLHVAAGDLPAITLPSDVREHILQREDHQARVRGRADHGIGLARAGGAWEKGRGEEGGGFEGKWREGVRSDVVCLFVCLMG